MGAVCGTLLPLSLSRLYVLRCTGLCRGLREVEEDLDLDLARTRGETLGLAEEEEEEEARMDLHLGERASFISSPVSTIIAAGAAFDFACISVMR